MKKVRGFTLIELMIAITVLAILLGIAVPSFRDLIQNNRATAATNEVVAALQLARSEALKQRVNVVVCRRNAAGTACENGADWAAGWLVSVGGAPMQVWPRPQGNPVLTGPNTGLTFLPSGLTNAGAAVTVNIAFPDCSGNQRRTISVSPTGRVNTARIAC